VKVGTNLHAYGKTFLAEWPEETTDLFITYYTGKYVPAKPDAEGLKPASPPPSISVALSSFRDAARDAADISKYVQYLPYMADKPKSTTATTTSPPSSHHNIPPITSYAAPKPTTAAAAPTTDPSLQMPTYQPPRPRAAFSIFVDFPGCFVRFLETMMEDEGFARREGRDVDDICTTLFEAYLRNSRSGKVEERSMWEQKATSLLTGRKVSPITSRNEN